LKNLWDDSEAAKCQNDLDMRVYTSNILGQSDELVLHGGGNTSVKSIVDGEDILYVKGSGWDLVSIKAEGFAPVKMATLLEMAKMKNLSDIDMVSGQKAAMTDATAPNPSVEAILHALIPFKVVDHTHADAVVTISNSKEGQEHIAMLYPNFLIIPYVMPGFILAQKIYEMTEHNFDWDTCEGIILHNHGIFTFDNDAKKSYDKMIDAVSLAEDFLNKNAQVLFDEIEPIAFYVEDLNIDKFMHINQTPLALHYASQDDLRTKVTRGVLTPEHIIRTKRVPLVLEDNDIEDALRHFKVAYETYFSAYKTDEIILDSNPKYAVIKDFGIVTFAKTQKEADVINDVISHTMLAVLRADKLGGYQSISIADSFDMEYWELEQAKLK
jgi:rhamnose utilization protein RhaD (predicted bifunctional aldolase and dehydrogenase)